MVVESDKKKKGQQQLRNRHKTRSIYAHHYIYMLQVNYFFGT